MNKLDIFVFFIFILKIIFIFLAIFHLYDKVKGKTNTPIDKKVLFWKERVEFIFVCMMALLLIYLFNPINKTPIILDKETKLVLFLFGIILIVTAKWKVFFTESKLLHL